MKQDRYIYPAIFDYAADGISVEFADLPGCLTFGKSDREAVEMAKEAMALHLYGMEQGNDPIPNATNIKDLNVEPNQTVVLIDVWMSPFRDEMNNKAVKKTLTIPKWLDDIAKEKNVNYSHVLKEALIEYLGVKEKR
ncbi:type II toxin-antitoxin system HicB family antitoxin [Bacillus spongiae]|uniref:Type II toxin-antitoxin system HicB family antitoxin n=1 Tax=Bacillus spongiae TaxID=2683610 RepID=A0ABU8HCT4_9BACI